MPVGGGDAQRVTFKGDYNISPRISPDGKSLAYVSRRGGRFQVYVLDLATSQEALLTETGFDLDRQWLVVDGAGSFVRGSR